MEFHHEVAGASDSVESGATIKSQNQIACRLDENEMITMIEFVKRIVHWLSALVESTLEKFSQ
jgi:hypothetical protein